MSGVNSTAWKELPTTLYRLFDVEGTLLYVSMAANPGKRFEAHRQAHKGRKLWWGEVASATFEHFERRADAAAAEELAIATERPLYNLRPGRPKSDRLVCSDCGRDEIEVQADRLSLSQPVRKVPAEMPEADTPPPAVSASP